MPRKQKEISLFDHVDRFVEAVADNDFDTSEFNPTTGLTISKLKDADIPNTKNRRVAFLYLANMIVNSQHPMLWDRLDLGIRFNTENKWDLEFYQPSDVGMDTEYLWRMLDVLSSGLSSRAQIPYGSSLPLSDNNVVLGPFTEVSLEEFWQMLKIVDHYRANTSIIPDLEDCSVEVLDNRTFETPSGIYVVVDFDKYEKLFGFPSDLNPHMVQVQKEDNGLRLNRFA